MRPGAKSNRAIHTTGMTSKIPGTSEADKVAAIDPRPSI
jgi:hypothetical protein